MIINSSKFHALIYFFKCIIKYLYKKLFIKGIKKRNKCLWNGREFFKELWVSDHQGKLPYVLVPIRTTILEQDLPEEARTRGRYAAWLLCSRISLPGISIAFL